MDIVQEVFRLASLSNNMFIIEGSQLRNAFRNDFNQEKGQTSDSEFTRWLKFIYYVHNIEHNYDWEKDQYHFKRITTK